MHGTLITILKNGSIMLQDEGDALQQYKKSRILLTFKSAGIGIGPIYFLNACSRSHCAGLIGVCYSKYKQM